MNKLQSASAQLKRARASEAQNCIRTTDAILAYLAAMDMCEHVRSITDYAMKVFDIALRFHEEEKSTVEDEGGSEDD